jgi:DNA-binding CsgD family transcriptional regulator
VLQNLSQHYPALSRTERKICALLHDGLSIKEMAGVLKVTNHVIENHRYNIRKKMGLGRKASLVAVLSEL